MKISHRNFMASQAFYGITISGRIPSDEELKKQVEASYRVADMQIAFAQKTRKRKAKRG